MKMMFKQKQKQLKSFFLLKKKQARVLEGELDAQVKELVKLLHTEAKVI